MVKTKSEEWVVNICGDSENRECKGTAKTTVATDIYFLFANFIALKYRDRLHALETMENHDLAFSLSAD